MEGRLSCLLVLILQIVSWVSATSRSFAPNEHGTQVAGVHQPGQVSMGFHLKSKQVVKSTGVRESSKEEEEEEEKEGTRGVSKIGSSPPSCEHKCYGCNPCEPIQVPTISGHHSHVGLQYSNYEPMDWKCKCGPSFYTP